MSEEKAFTKAELDAAIADAKEAQDEKNRELLAEVKDLKVKVRASQEIKPEDLSAAEARAEKAEQALAASVKAVKDLTTERDKAVKSLETETGFTQRLLIQDGLKTALLANGVKDEDFIDSLTAKFTTGASIKVDGETRAAMYGDKAMADHIKEWAASDAGKKFVAAPANGGGGASGGKGGQEGAKTVSRAAFDGMGQVERATFAKDGGKVVDQAA